MQSEKIGRAPPSGKQADRETRGKCADFNDENAGEQQLRLTLTPLPGRLRLNGKLRHRLQD
jgi:hypothetical protein